MREPAHETSDLKRKMMCLPLPTYKLVNRIAALRGQTLSDALYTVFREELYRVEDGEAWALAPAPFSIKPTYTDTGCGVLFWHPAVDTLILNRREATDIAEAIRATVDGSKSAFILRTASRDRNVKVSHGGRYVAISINGDTVTMIFPTAIDVADALISASVHAGPIPEGGSV